MSTFTVYSKPNCAFCDKAKMLLTSKSLSYEELILDVGQEKLDDKTYISKESLLEKIPSARTMPQILVDGVSIGGYAELVKHLNT